MAEIRDLDSFVRPAGDGAVSMELAVEGVHCGACIRRIEQGLKKLDGIVDARVNFTNRRLNVVWRENSLRPVTIVDELDRIGYPAQPFQPRLTEAADAAESKHLLTAVGVAGFAAMNIMLLSVSVWAGNVSDITEWQRDFFHWLSAAIAIPAAAYSGQPFFRSAWKALRGGGVNMDVPISLGVILALGLSVVETINHAEHAYFDSAVMLLFFLLCGRYFDHAMRQRTRAVAGNLAALKVEFANRLTETGAVVRTPVGTLRPDDRVLVRPGERVPADGIVLAGNSQIDESFVTGETLRRSVEPSATVYAGTMNYGGALDVKVTAAGEGTLIDEIERLLEKAVIAKSRYVRLADRAAGYYAPVVHTAALLTLIGWMLAGASFHDSIVTAISVLIITCPCALALAVPVVQVVAAGALFRGGVFLNVGDAIERIAEADVVVFDKTGTLTLPEPRIVNADTVAPDLLRVAVRLAKSSSHPLAAVVARADHQESPVAGAVEDSGLGVRAVIDGVEARFGSPTFCGLAEPADDKSDASASRIAVTYGERGAVLVIRQLLRSDAVAVAEALRGLGLALMIVSGDRASAVAPIARALGIEDWTAEVKPAEKVALLEKLRAAGRRVLMVGDGLNDSPALATAHVSLAPIDAADLSKAHADAVFLGERLAPVRDTIVVARHARALMRQNLSLAVIYNVIAVPIAIAGFVTPLIAAAAMSGSSILVTANAFRLHRRLRRAQPATPATRASEATETPVWTS